MLQIACKCLQILQQPNRVIDLINCIQYTKFTGIIKAKFKFTLLPGMPEVSPSSPQLPPTTPSRGLPSKIFAKNLTPEKQPNREVNSLPKIFAENSNQKIRLALPIF
ncbi:hypothetical protein DJ568_16160 [Mucilaginibacter hurinus]|uniref:Uncharacterized protein n=1 Tax=Mucilaginibacter hurinus TaxID=2201324 RepID=A0A367GKC8_9SPHI|nr:hypothetical protein DJ568_16160 [Mucilaginibacter hurinus]